MFDLCLCLGNVAKKQRLFCTVVHDYQTVFARQVPVVVVQLKSWGVQVVVEELEVENGRCDKGDW